MGGERFLRIALLRISTQFSWFDCHAQFFFWLLTMIYPLFDLCWRVNEIVWAIKSISSIDLQTMPLLSCTTVWPSSFVIIFYQSFMSARKLTEIHYLQFSLKQPFLLLLLSSSLRCFCSSKFNVKRRKYFDTELLFWVKLFFFIIV